ncbi:MAG: hypothetical protein J6Y12_09535 [Lachnospiraceae bacterium]|nr:hypothetical protein [Lachnospiraceae bacterium]
MFEWKGFAKFWLWFVFIVNIIALVISVLGLVGSIVLGPVFIVLMLVTVILEVAIIVGVTTLLFKKKKVGFYIICGCQVCNIILSFILGAMQGNAVSSGVRTIGSAIISVLILYFAIKNYWDQLA